jgi:hypothetical protein
MLVRENELKHYGILGMKWGVRRYQNEDGSLTEAGKKRYDKDMKRGIDRMDRRERYIAKKTKDVKQAAKLGTMTNIRRAANIDAENKKVRDFNKKIRENPENLVKFGKITGKQRVATIAGSSAASAGAAFLGYVLTEELLFTALPPVAIAAGGAYIYHLTKR